MWFFSGEDWQCPKCKINNEIGTSVNNIAASKNLNYLFTEFIHVPFICNNCGHKEIIVVECNVFTNTYDIKYKNTALQNKDIKWRDKLLKEAGLIMGD